MIGEVRIRMPGAVARGATARVRVLCVHPNERVEKRNGKAVDRNYRFVNRVVARYLGREIAVFELSTSIGENPAFTIPLRASAPGPFEVTFFDTHGGRFTGSGEVIVA